jgi:hypothetical protein
MARAIVVRRDASDLTIEDNPYGDYGDTGGREVMDDLLREVYPTIGYTARKVVGTAGNLAPGRTQQSVQFFETISGAPKGSTAYASARRNFERYAGGRTPKLPTVEGYQARYELANGERSPILDDLIVAAGGEVPEPEDEGYGELPPGELEIEVYAAIKVDTGKRAKGRPQAQGGAYMQDIRTRAVKITIPRARQADAIRDPLAEWERQLGDAIPQFEISDVQWIEARFTPKG